MSRPRTGGIRRLENSRGATVARRRVLRITIAISADGERSEVGHEEAFDCSTRNYYFFQRCIDGGRACVRLGRLRSEPASRRGRSLRLGRTESRLLLEKDRSPRYAHAQWHSELPMR